MNTSELIARLREVDPEGTTPVNVDGADVYCVDRQPAYYDGQLQQLVHDPALRGKAWSIIGAKITSTGMKISVRTLSIREVLVDMPDLPIEGGDEATIARWRAEARSDD